MTRIAILGAGGMLGRDLMSVLGDYEPTGFTRDGLDITDESAVKDSLQGFDLIINAAAYTKVDEAEESSDQAFAVNAKGALNVAAACTLGRQRLIHISTDYVFDGFAQSPYPEEHITNPQSTYGASKAAGEKHVQSTLPDSCIILRTAWLYGVGGSNFVNTILKLADSNDTISVVNDQIGQPTWTRDLANMIDVLIKSEIRSGIFHGTNAGRASWFDFAQTIFNVAGLDPSRVVPTSSDAFKRPAPRPLWSVLSHAEWARNGLPMPRLWQDAFDDAWGFLEEGIPQVPPRLDLQ